MALVVNPRTTTTVSAKGYKFTWTPAVSYDTLVTQRVKSPTFRACGYGWYLVTSPSVKVQDSVSAYLYLAPTRAEAVHVTFTLAVLNYHNFPMPKNKIFNTQRDNWGRVMIPIAQLKELLIRETAFTIIVDLFAYSDTVGVQLSSDLGSLLFDESNSDIKFMFGQEYLPGHSLILSARSPVFAAMLNGGMLEAKTKEVVIADMTIDIFEVLLEYVYTDAVSPENLEKHKYELLMLADKYNLPGLKIMCEYCLLENVHLKNACKLFSCTDKYNMPLARATILKFIIANSAEIFKSEGYGRLILENPKLAVEIQQSLVNPEEEQARKKVKLE